MAPRGLHTVIRIGGVEAPATLYKASGKPKEAKHEVRRESAGDASRGHAAATVTAPPQRDALTGAVEQEAALPVTVDKLRHGVTGPDGEFVDLTDELARIDELCLLDGMEVESTIYRSAVPTHRVRDAHYVAGSSPALAALWTGLRHSNRAALVRWTKRTNQALGALVARGGKHEPPHLMLLELEWAANEHEVPAGCELDVAAVPADVAEAAESLVAAFADPPQVLDSLVDERAARRAELLEVARATGTPGQPLLELPEDPEVREAGDRFAAAVGG